MPSSLLPMPTQSHWPPGFNFNVEEWDAKGLHYETLAICRTIAQARAAFEVAVEEKPAGRFTIRHRIRIVKRQPEGDRCAAIASRRCYRAFPSPIF
jgi:hypothetical protein